VSVLSVLHGSRRTQSLTPAKKKRRVSKVVIYASALLAVLLEERGAATVQRHLATALISAVNLSEVIVAAVERGLVLESVMPVLTRLSLETFVFEAEQAYVAASFRSATRSLGLSLGDRACLALGLKLGPPALTADQRWAKVDVGAKVEVIR
jgi:PIN domain nuclease of toxin-antitoxin system